MFALHRASTAALGVIGAAIALSGSAYAGTVPIVSDGANSAGGVGSYTGSLSYNAATFKLTIVLTNTTPTGLITGVVFNIGGADPNASAMLVSAPNASWEGMPGPINGQPYGSFDAGAALGGSFEGGGSPNAGIGSGLMGTLVFMISATDAALLTETSFISSMNSTSHADFVVRIRGITGEVTSDKVPGLVAAPLPTPASLGAAGLLGLGLAGRRRRR